MFPDDFPEGLRVSVQYALDKCWHNFLAILSTVCRLNIEINPCNMNDSVAKFAKPFEISQRIAIIIVVGIQQDKEFCLFSDGKLAPRRRS
jgi:hypothetical protein